ncbi:MAG: FAD binding domain-containing protein [Acidimicrobiales bacterium]|jgi:carbon-monoxide dehydrogenase medium subunit|nr:FAD binding domain-containing protein [Acidimicrobiales bacterium]
MKPAPFDYFDPSTVDEVLDLLGDHGDDAVVIAGGQSLVPLLNLRLAQPGVVIDPRRCTDLRSFTVDDGGLTAGALVTAAELEASPDACALPGLHDALRQIGHVQIRNRTTIGGSIAHADPAAELPALLLALEGSVTLRSRDRGARTVGADALLVGSFMTAREPDELLTQVRLPRFGGPVTVLELGARPGDFATVGVVVGLADAPAGVTEARVVVFGAGGRPQRILAAEAALVGAPAAAGLDAAVGAVRADTEATGDAHASADYRRHVAGTLVGRAVRSLAGIPTGGTA